MNAIAIQKHTQFEFTAEQRKMILGSFLNGASEAEAEVLMELAKLRGLNPITKQIHFVKRWDSEKNTFVWASQVGIDGFRAIAERTGLYDGQDEAEFAYDKDGRVFSCKVKVYRKDWGRPAVGLAHFSEFAQYKKDRSLTKMWAEKPHVMLAKCAEAIAFRRGFPEDTSGLYSPEEMPEAGVERDVTPPPPVAVKTLGPVVLDANGQPTRLVTFGPAKGKVISLLSGSEIEATIALGEERVAASPTALWASQVSACLKDLRHEKGERVEQSIANEQAKKAFQDPPNEVRGYAEPPPHTDEDAPSFELAADLSTGEVVAPPDAPCPNYGKGKGGPLSALSVGDLEYYKQGCLRTLGDPTKATYHKKEQKLLASLEAWIAFRQ